MSYSHESIEKKWQDIWRTRSAFATELHSNKPKYYVLDMFPYPSGAGLHVGHPLGYTATDIVARYKRAKGFNVLHPMGWDSFGLPAEQYAIRTGTHPAQTTKQNIATYKRQLKSLGFSYDWGRELATSHPGFYKWTQWIFTKLYQRGLAYEAEISVNYCPALGTVLANEEVENGRSVEGGHLVEKRPLRQWILRITQYADRLLDDLDSLDWPEGVKRLQRNWIGRSEGCDISFHAASQVILVYTTRPDTLYGVTYLVLAPEHPLVASLTTEAQRPAVELYQKRTAVKSDIDRLEHSKDKTGVFTGSYAKHPATGEPLPIWVADYVLGTYGHGAVMAVPSDDERDFAFAQQHQLPVIQVFEQERLVNSGPFNGLTSSLAKEAVANWLEQEGKGERKVNYKLRDWLFSRQRYWGEPIPILHFEDGTKRALTPDELPLIPPDVENYKPTGEGLSPLASVKEWVEVVDPKTGKKALRETNTMPTWAGSCWYYLRFIDPRNEEDFCNFDLLKEWLPVDLYIGGVEHAVLHLLYARFWHKVLFDLGLVPTSEPFQKLYNQGLITCRSYKKTTGGYVPLEDVRQEGEDYFHRTTGELLVSQIEKMSKSRLNVINPDEIVETYGADALRLYEMFMGPLDKEKVWNTDGVSGCRRFLSRFFELAEQAKDIASPEALRLAHRLVHGVAEDIEKLQFNTAVSKFMTFSNELAKLPHVSKEAIEMATIALAPFAPHCAEEIWEKLGHNDLICHQSFPKVDPSYLVDAQVTYVVQVNGKLRGRFELPKDQDEETIVALAKAHPNISQHLKGNIQSVIFVPNRLLNFVVNE
ncbi:MAG: leucine--tRNA ligase [Verrucomicrobia bacterium]|nr:leucine--tRNA ligase [Verrucomicrobiota bacterium]